MSKMIDGKKLLRLVRFNKRVCEGKKIDENTNEVVDYWLGRYDESVWTEAIITQLMEEAGNE